jgi:hypothetical protein
MSSSILIYEDKENNIYMEVQLEEDTVWLNQNQLANLFKKTKQNISLHARNIFKEGELDEHAVVKESLTTAADGKEYLTKYYNLDVIISVGYRVKSKQGTRFRIWANKTLKDYLVQGYALDQKRLNNQKYSLQELQKTISLFKQAQSKVLSKTPNYLQEKFRAWLEAVSRVGLLETRKRPGWHDEQLVGSRKGQGAIRLNKQWCAIYIL